MNFRLIARVLGLLLLPFGASMILCAPWSAIAGEYRAASAILLSSVITMAAGGGLVAAGWGAPAKFYQREGIAVVALMWVLASLFGALPFVLTGSCGLVYALFETVSGLTTCGASIFDDVEALPRGVLFWRSLTHWLGGLGIVVLFMNVLPYLGVGGKMLMRYESTGAHPMSLRPRMKANALVLLKIYLGLTALQTAALLSTGKMDLFDSLCHTFGTLATGGFSTRQASIAAYDSLAVEIITIVFMVAGATSFALHDGFLHRKWKVYWNDEEFRVYIAILALSTFLIAANVHGWFGADPVGGPAPSEEPPAMGHALRASAFSVTTMMTNTGFVTDDFDLWPTFSRMLLVVLMFVGGCAGSTCGGIKVFRVIIVWKALLARMERTFRPSHVRSLRVSGHVVSPELQTEAMTYMLAYLLFFAAASLVMAAIGVPFVSALSAVAACMSCSGPGLELLGASETYSVVPDSGLLFLCLCMVVGRLEIFAVLVLFRPAFWRIGGR